MNSCIKEDLRFIKSKLGDAEFSKWRTAMRTAGLWSEDTIMEKSTSLLPQTLYCACNPMTDQTCTVCRIESIERQAGYKAPDNEVDDDDPIPF